MENAARDHVAINIPLLRSKLALREWPQWRLAQAVSVNPCVFSQRIRQRLPMPAALVRKIERVLELKPGSLVAAAESSPQS